MKFSAICIEMALDEIVSKLCEKHALDEALASLESLVKQLQEMKADRDK